MPLMPCPVPVPPLFLVENSDFDALAAEDMQRGRLFFSMDRPGWGDNNNMWRSGVVNLSKRHATALLTGALAYN